ncbi:putative ABC transport system permease protein [Lewinella marina]|uniref:Peptide ABC transporter permease n=1 Tax=Neolewinella marina TaxID=438751 RepID=A0A2G0CD44_9BACT|nr:ABC transporter permease [Neolewinella marina]NJB86921.1 putative ABC transport system permease protein [Neolewinella marina]PHK97882.1 peptide ABC transporter permease [Neolewinella marina]
MVLSKVIAESFRQAWQQLTGNKLRTFLSLLGISIGIFCIIGVLSAVQSLQKEVSGSLAKLGDDVIYIDKWPWKDNSDDWWEYYQRPYPDHDDYEALKENLATANLVSYWTVPGTRTLKYEGKAVEGGYLFVTTYELDRLFSIEIDRGRYWSTSEYRNGTDRILLGHEIAEQLFGPVNPIGREVKMQGRKYQVIGTLAPAGDDLVNPLDFDDAIMVTYNNAARFINLKTRNQFGGTIGVKAAGGVELERLQDDIRGILRANRQLRPREDDNFALNELSMTTEALGNIFGVLNVIGLVIGLFSIVVGAISVANIMFVSVKERTSLIGVKKALGARQYIILLEFLTESVILCVIGGAMGLLMVVAITSVINLFLPGFQISLSVLYAIAGVVISAVVGIFAGLVPALLAARMDPVEAMRS